MPAQKLYSGSGVVDGVFVVLASVFFVGDQTVFGITSRDFWWVVFLFNLSVALVF
jgi:hypothetical protein